MTLLASIDGAKVKLVNRPVGAVDGTQDVEVDSWTAEQADRMGDNLKNLAERARENERKMSKQIAAGLEEEAAAADRRAVELRAQIAGLKGT